MIKLGIIGAGNMAEALLSGVLKAKLMAPEQIKISDVREERLAALAARYKVKTARNNQDVARDAETVVLAVKPQQIKEILDEICRTVEPHQLVISIAAGIPLRVLEGKFTRPVPVIRVMPNTPAMVQEVAAGIASGRFVQKVHREFVVKLFNSMGEAVEVDESLMDAVTAVSGSGPAYFFHMIEALVEGGVAEGLEPDVARALAVQTMFGAAKMLSQTAEDPAKLRVQVTSPGGTTEAALAVLTERDFAGAVKAAVQAARARSEELAKLA